MTSSLHNDTTFTLVIRMHEKLNGRSTNGYFFHLKELEVEIKWPNDIYYKRQVKLGGILVTAFTLGRDTTAIVGQWSSGAVRV